MKKRGEIQYEQIKRRKKEKTGAITYIIVPGEKSKFLNVFKTNNGITIPWKNIKCIGEDIILVDI